MKSKEKVESKLKSCEENWIIKQRTFTQQAFINALKWVLNDED